MGATEININKSHFINGYVSALRQAFRISTAPGVSPCTHMVWAAPSRANPAACAAAA
jgi:hypothetical protein